ncbi:hypothetical protein ACIGW8_34315, partial [Streptomyces sioyaensis]
GDRPATVRCTAATPPPTRHTSTLFTRNHSRYENSGALTPDAFRAAAPDWLAPALGGSDAFHIPS